MLRAKSIVLFHAKKFVELYEFIEMNKFADENHLFLQRLWNEAHYAEVFFSLNYFKLKKFLFFIFYKKIKLETVFFLNIKFNFTGRITTR